MPRYNPQTYMSQEWFNSLDVNDEWNERALLAALAILGIPKTFLDVGCGNAVLVDLMYNLTGVGRIDTSASGMELTRPMRRGDRCPVSDADGKCSLVTAHDLRGPLEMPQYRSELVVCWQVGDCLPSRSADALCKTLGYHSRDWLIFTAARPGDHQGSLNPQYPQYWDDKLMKEGLIFDAATTMYLRSAWESPILQPDGSTSSLTGPCSWLPENVQVYRKVM